MSDFLTLLKLLAAICGIFYVIKIYRNAKAKHPVFTYDQHSTANSSDWRWRKPDVALALAQTDDEQTSQVQLPVQWLFVEKICILTGYFGAGFLVFLYGILLLRHAGWAEYLLGLLFVFLSLALLNVGSRVSALILHADHLVIIERYAFFLKHTHVYRRGPKMHFEGRLESVFELTYDHTEPDFKLYLSRSGVLTRRKRFILTVNQSQGSWLVGGLNYWVDHGGSSQSGLNANGESVR